RLISPRQPLHVPRQFDLAQRRRRVERPLEPGGGRYLLEKFFDGLDPDLGQHGLLVFRGVRDVGQTGLLRLAASFCERSGRLRLSARKSSRLNGINALPTRSAFRTAPASSAYPASGPAR